MQRIDITVEYPVSKHMLDEDKTCPAVTRSSSVATSLFFIGFYRNEEVSEAASLREASKCVKEGLIGMHVGGEVMTNICEDTQEERMRRKAKCKEGAV